MTAERRPARVVKFGGTSLATAFRLRRAARRVEEFRRAGERVVVVVSARGDTTDRLLALLGGVSKGGGAPHARESDRALATGEDLAAALLAAALTSRGVPARSLRGGEAEIAAEGDHGAGVHDADPNRSRRTRRFERLTHDELVALATDGARVVSPEAARLAAERRIPLRVYRWDEPIGGPRGGTVVASLPLPRLLAEAV